jgi:hypothetical protein
MRWNFLDARGDLAAQQDGGDTHGPMFQGTPKSANPLPVT